MDLRVLVGMACIALAAACKGNGAAPDTPRLPPGSRPAQICGDAAMLTGPASPPAGARVVPAGDNSNLAFDFREPGVTWWFAPGQHTLGTGEYDQIQPGEGSTFIGGPGAFIDGQGVNRYAFTTDAANVRIAYLDVRNFVSPNDEGVVNHDFARGWVVEHNDLHHNQGAAVFVGTDNVLRDNCIRDNGQYGFQGGGSNLLLDHNEIAHNDTGDWEHTPYGNGNTGGGKFWDVDGAVVTNNWIHDNLSVGLWADTNDRNFTIEGNYLENNYSEAIFYEISYNAVIRANTFVRNTLGKGKEFADRGDNFPVAAIYLSEAGGDGRVPGVPAIEVANNYFEDNWSGVTLWENADRYCASGANTSTGYCTLVSPGATLDTCASAAIADPPLHDDCRWKTQNVSVHDNEFHVTPANVPGCTGGFCTRQAIISNWGSWDPYSGWAVADAITAGQNNHFANNRYFGPWRFMVHDTGQTVDWAEWRATPFDQDVGSTLSP